MWPVLHVGYGPASPAARHPGSHQPAPPGAAAHPLAFLDLGVTFLYTLTFWLLLYPFVKEKLLKKVKVPTALMEVMVADPEPKQAQTLLWGLGEPVTGVYSRD